MIYIHLPGLGGFEWDAHNVAHIARHGVQPCDAEEEIALYRDSLRTQLGLLRAGRKRFSKAAAVSAARYPSLRP